MRASSSAAGWRSPIRLGLLVGVAGLFMTGVVGAVVGFLAGLVVARRPRPVLLGSCIALFAAAILTILERPLSGAGLYDFPNHHPLANVAAAIAAVLLLAGLVDVVARLDLAAVPHPASEPAHGSRSRTPKSTIAAILAAILVAAISVSQLGDRRWEGPALAVALAVLLLGAALAISHYRGKPRSGSA